MLPARSLAWRRAACPSADVLPALRPPTRVSLIASGMLQRVRQRQRDGAALAAAVATGAVGRLLAAATVQLLPLKRRVVPDMPLPVRIDLPTGSRWFWFRDGSELLALREIFGEGEYEAVGHGDPRLIVDLGANAGQAALWFRSRFPQARIISAEPDPRTFATLIRNHSGDPMITLAQVAIAGTDDFYGLAREPDSSWGTRVVPDGGSDVDRVQAVRLETLMQQHAIEWVDLLKVDIEGMEHEALGRCEALRRVGRVIGEIHADRIGVPVDRALEDMRSSGGFDTAVLNGDIFVLERR